MRTFEVVLKLRREVTRVLASLPDHELLQGVEENGHQHANAEAGAHFRRVGTAYTVEVEAHGLAEQVKLFAIATTAFALRSSLNSRCDLMISLHSIQF